MPTASVLFLNLCKVTRDDRSLYRNM